VGARFSSSGFPSDVLDVLRVLPWAPSSVVAVERKPSESVSISPLPPVLGRSPALGKSLSVPGGWVRTREDPRSWGSSRDESQATSHDMVIVFGFRRMRTGPFAFARGQISPDYYIPAPSVPPEHYRSGWRRVRGGTHFHPSGPGNRVTSTWSGELPFLSRIPG